MPIRLPSGVIPLTALLVMGWPTPGVAQPVVADARAAATRSDIVPEPPELPQVIARDEAGHATVRAVRIEQPPLIDGDLEDEVYQQIAPIGGFIQQEPHEGAPSTENTDVWVLFDDRHVYVSARLWQDPATIVAAEMRRDNLGLTKSDNFAVIFDTFRDRRAGYLFHISAAGGMFDGHITDESQNNREWNTVWEGKVGRFSGGWTVEMAIPFRSLRYGGGGEQIWGINFRRILVDKNELTTLTPVPASYAVSGLLHVSFAATLVGVQTPPASKGLEIKPYALSSIVTDRVSVPSFSNEWDGDVGFDVKYGLTRGLTFDFTYHTDFAQVEEDEQQVNLTRFNLFFPERREFFLEGAGLFHFGGLRLQASNPNLATEIIPIMFFSRRIGLAGNRPVPIEVGARLTGKVGKFTIGAANIQTGEDEHHLVEDTNFTVLRVRRDILRRSSVGIIATNRSKSLLTDGSNQAVGVDTLLSLHREMVINSFYAVTNTPGRSGGEVSYRAQVDYPADLYGFQLEHMTVGENFNPEVGFLRRQNFRRNFAQARISRRPPVFARKLNLQGSFDYITDNDGQLETRESLLMFQSVFGSGDTATVEYTRTFEFLPERFEISPGVILPIGGYNFENVTSSYLFGPQRPISGTLTLGRGSFFSGDRTDVGFNGRVDVNSRLIFEPRFSVARVDLVEGKFTTTLIGTRANLSFTPQMLLAALVQYNSDLDTVSVNIRYRWEYQPGSDLYVVFNEGRDTLGPVFRDIENRTFAIKLTRLFRF